MHPTFLPVLPLLLFGLVSCKKAAPAMGEMPPAAVSVIEVATETVTSTRELPGRIDAVRTAEVRARVPGILMEKSFEEGADIEAGQTLFKIDPAPLIAVRDAAAADLARAEAQAQQAENIATRYRGLADSNAVSRQDLDNAESALKVAQADTLAATSALRTAELNLGYATVTAPISGRIGRADVTEGALVGQGDATRLAVIQQLDPIYFDFTQSGSELIALRRAMIANSENPQTEHPPATLILEDGTEYEHPGRLLFSEASVDETTGMVTLRAEFPNPDRLLLPGMFARVKIVQGVSENTVTIPQRAVTRMQGGAGSVMIVDEENLAQLRVIETGEAVGENWIVTSGLSPGERVIMEGHMKSRPGAPVAPEPFVSATDAD